LIAAAVGALAQQTVKIDPTIPAGYEQVITYSGSNVVATCLAQSTLAKRTQRVISISAATNANPVVFTSTGHGFPLSARPLVTISGGTGNWTAINGPFTATIVDANTFSILVNSTSLGALAGTITFTTTAPRITIAEWQVQVIAYSGSNPIWTGWMGGDAGFSQICNNATGTGNIQ
jgi:hypothetical protein